ncbi:MAG: hypothetical protein ABIF82_12510 [Planctomycetota bacterium]
MANVGALYMTAGIKTEQMDKDLKKVEQKLTYWQRKQQEIQGRQQGGGPLGSLASLQMAAGAAGFMIAAAAARKFGQELDRSFEILSRKGATARDVVREIGSSLGTSLPIVGGFFDLGESIGKWLWGMRQAELETKRLTEDNKRLDEANKKVLATARELLKIRQAEAAVAAKMRASMSGYLLRAAGASGSASAIDARIAYEEKLSEIATKRAAEEERLGPRLGQGVDAKTLAVVRANATRTAKAEDDALAEVRRNTTDVHGHKIVGASAAAALERARSANQAAAVRLREVEAAAAQAGQRRELSNMEKLLDEEEAMLKRRRSIDLAEAGALAEKQRREEKAADMPAARAYESALMSGATIQQVDNATRQLEGRMAAYEDKRRTLAEKRLLLGAQMTQNMGLGEMVMLGREYLSAKGQEADADKALAETKKKLAEMDAIRQRLEGLQKEADLAQQKHDRRKQELMSRATEGARLQEEALTDPERFRKTLEERAKMVEQGSLSMDAFKTLAERMIPAAERGGAGAFGLITSARMSLSGMGRGADAGEAAKKTADNTKAMKSILEQMLGKLGLAA